MELQHLRAFVAIADAGGFGRAAVRLHLSQPALSRQIRSLEEELDVRLFDRIGRRIQLTSEGEDLLQRSRRLLTDAGLLGERARALKSGDTGVLRVGATPQVMENLLAGFLPRYRHRHPGVAVHLIEEGGARLRDCLDRGEMHVTLMLAGDERFHCHLLIPAYCLAILSTAHRLSRRTVLEFAELADEPVLVLRRGFGSRDWFEAACRVTHIHPHVLLESGAPHTLIALAGAGYGIAIVPSPVFSSTAQLRRTGARAIPVVHGGKAIGGWVCVAWDPRRYQPSYAGRFVEELVAYARRKYPGQGLIRRAPPLPRPKTLP